MILATGVSCSPYCRCHVYEGTSGEMQSRELRYCLFSAAAPAFCPALRPAPSSASRSRRSFRTSELCGTFGSFRKLLKSMLRTECVFICVCRERLICSFDVNRIHYLSYRLDLPLDSIGKHFCLLTQHLLDVVL